MKCPLCKGLMEESKTNLPYEIGEEYMVVVKDVPALFANNVERLL